MFMHLFVIWCYLQNCKNKTKRLKGDEPEPIVVNIGYKIIKQKPKPKRKMFILEINQANKGNLIYYPEVKALGFSGIIE